MTGELILIFKIIDYDFAIAECIWQNLILIIYYILANIFLFLLQ